MIPQPKPIKEFTEIIQNYPEVVQKFTPASLPINYIDIQYQKDTFQNDSLHAHINCSDLSHPFAATPLITVPIQDAVILYDGPIGSKKFIELTLDFRNNTEHKFNAGDVVGILVSNSGYDVSRVVARLPLCEKLDNVCYVSIKSATAKKNAKVPLYIPKTTSARAILRDCLDLRSIPKKLFLRSLAEYTTDIAEKNLLLMLSSKEGTLIYNKMILEETKTFLDVLDLCSSCYPPLSLLIEHLPRLKPRPYSIANSNLACPDKVKFIFSVLHEKPGVGTSFLAEKVYSWLENSEKPQNLSFYFRETNNFCFRPKEDSILIGIGCGVSPFLGFLEHKDCLVKQNISELGSTWLFVGSTCQESAVRRDELLDYQVRGVLQRLYESFSRDTKADCSDFKHVQDHLKSNAHEIAEQLYRKQTILYVCADGTEISKSIEKCIQQCLSKGLECTDEEANIFIKEMRTTKRYREDIWI